MNTNIAIIKELLDGTSITVDTYSPGDGVTRYRFFGPCICGSCGESPDYFGGCNKLHTILGGKSALYYAHGVHDAVAMERSIEDGRTKP